MVNMLVEGVEVPVELEEVVELRHEVARYRAASGGQKGRELC